MKQIKTSKLRSNKVKQVDVSSHYSNRDVTEKKNQTQNIFNTQFLKYVYQECIIVPILGGILP